MEQTGVMGLSLDGDGSLTVIRNALLCTQEAFSQLLSRPGMYDAFWSLLREDVTVMVPVESLSDEVEYKRYYKTANGFTGKNVELFMGNFVSLLARERVGAKKGFDRLKEWECWPVIRDYFAEKGMGEKDVYKWLVRKLEERTVRWGGRCDGTKVRYRLDG